MGVLERRYPRELAPLREGIVWESGHCPTCGSWPLLGEFRGLDQSRFLRCGLCADSWEVPRLWCPFCDTRDHDLLSLMNDAAFRTTYPGLVIMAPAAFLQHVRSHVAAQPG